MAEEISWNALVANVLEWKDRLVNNSVQSWEEMSAQRWIRIIVLVGAYMLIRPYLLAHAERSRKKREAKEAAELGLDVETELSANDFRGGKKTGKGDEGLHISEQNTLASSETEFAPLSRFSLPCSLIRSGSRLDLTRSTRQPGIRRATGVPGSLPCLESYNHHGRSAWHTASQRLFALQCMLAILTMAPLSVIGALSALPFALAHMQMSSPSPLRDPHAIDRPDEPKDYNILSPLNADGSNFACKGYHLNTPLTTVATYPAGSKQTLRLRGSATHSGGSCQISLSCDKGDSFYVIQSIIGGCPLRDSYSFTIPSDIPAAKKCLLSWTWFNKIGNREMYMNCAVVDITNKRLSKRGSQVSAAKALSRYPEMFVANLANVNDCRTQETADVIFDNPGKRVAYGNGDNASMQPSFRRGQCTGKPSKNAGSKDSSSSNSGSGNGQWSKPAQSNSGSGNGQWSKPAQSQSGSDDCAIKNRDGQWHPECDNSRPYQPERQSVQQQQQQQQQKQQPQRPQQPKKPQPPKNYTPEKPKKKTPDTKVQHDLDAYLASLYGRDLAGRDAKPTASYIENYSHSKDHPAPHHPHSDMGNCKHKSTGYRHNSPDRIKDLGSYTKDGVEYSHQDSQYHEDLQSAHKRVNREERWTSYDKRTDGLRRPLPLHRGSDGAYYKQQISDQTPAEASEENSKAKIKQASTDASNEVSTDDPNQTSTKSSNMTSTEVLMQKPSQPAEQTPDDAPVQKSWSELSEAEKFEAFLRRMVELSTNMASLVKYAWYPPPSASSRVRESYTETVQPKHAIRGLARRDVVLSARSPAQVYPGPSVGSISAPGDATDAEDGFQQWFPNLVQGLVTKRQLVDPVTSKASAEAGDHVNFFDALATGFWKLFGDLFDDKAVPDTDVEVTPELPVPDPKDIPLVLGEPDLYSGKPDFPDFQIPDLNGDFISPPQIPAPEPPAPELLPGYEEGPNGPIWVGEGPDPLASDSSPDEPSIIITIEPIDNSSFTPTPSEEDSACIEPIPNLGFNSCLGGCNHTDEELAAHEVYLKEFAQKYLAFKECLKAQALNGVASSPSHGIWQSTDDSHDLPSEAEDASGRRPRPGTSLPLIPYPIPDNSTAELPTTVTSEATPEEILDTMLPANDTAPPRVDLLPYQNKTLGELVSEIMGNPDVLAPLADDVEEEEEEEPEATNALQEAVDEAEAGVTVPTDPVLLDPTTLDSVADAFSWFLGPGPVVTDDVPADKDESPIRLMAVMAENKSTCCVTRCSTLCSYISFVSDTQLNPSFTIPPGDKLPDFTTSIKRDMKAIWLLLAAALSSMASSSTTRPDPRAPPEEYMQAVATSIKDLASGQRTRDSRMSGASTSRLILEGVVENLRIYRLYRQDMAREVRLEEEKEKERRKHKGHVEQSRRDRSRKRDQKHKSHRRRSREGGRDAHRERGGHSRHRAADKGGEHRRRRRHPHRSAERHGDRNLEDRKKHQNQRNTPVPGDKPDSQHLMSGALPAAAAPLGPDGTPFGSIPAKAEGVGFISLAKSIYQHVKAEQDAGHRSKGFAEKHVDAALQKRREKKADKRASDEEPFIERQTHGRRENEGKDRSRQRKSGSDRRSRRSEYPTYVPNNAAEASRGGSAPTIRVQSSTPPKQAETTLTPAVATPSVIPIAPPLPPPPPAPLPPPTVISPPVNPARNALFASILSGVSLRKVHEEDGKEGNAAWHDEACIDDVHTKPPAYEQTAHSHDVEVLEHAQAVEEIERTQEEACTARTKTPLTAPQPRTKMPSNFQGELVAKLCSMKLKGRGDIATEADPSGSSTLRPRASHETWRSVFTEHDEDNRMPNRQFRHDLGDRLSTAVSPQPSTVPSQTELRRVETPGPDVFVNLSANIAQPGWESGPSWNFSNVPVDGNGGPSGDRT
ncbi:hypothetical protein OPT61_g2544 [Boeremia exigua]|uniref:Uncharacterized protein n=1 Tax=Boeremia exigua TaxID=749465 RepID=A0ACC2IL46_9PLEO|nr:hypothetical protein OPT61_g2544 [Boeremia exigua]